MKKLVVLVFAGLCSQGFCMNYAEGARGAEGEGIFWQMHDEQERRGIENLNQLCNYFAANELDEPELDAAQALEEILPRVAEMITFDKEHLSNFMGSFCERKPFMCIQDIALLFQKSREMDDDRAFTALCERISVLSVDNISSVREPMDNLLTAYLDSYCKSFELVVFFIQRILWAEDARVTAMSGRMFSRIRKVVMQQVEIANRCARRLADGTTGDLNVEAFAGTIERMNCYSQNTSSRGRGRGRRR